MKLILKTANFGILDQVLPQENFNAFVKFFCDLDFERSSHKLLKVWRINDGEIFGGTSYKDKGYPFNNPMDWIHKNVYGLAKDQMKELVGEEGVDWEGISYRPYIYPPGSKISWHNDCGYSAACIFYCHKKWQHFWGGELMLATTKDNAVPKLTDATDDLFSRDYMQPILDQYGFGQYITPLPNRMVFTKTGVWHSINRVDPSAGDNNRFSIVAFFHKKKSI